MRQADKPTLNDKQKEARWMLYLSPLMIFSGTVLLVANSIDLVKAPRFYWAAQLAGDLGLFLMGVFGFIDAKYTFRTGIKRVSPARFAALLFLGFGELSRPIAQHQVSPMLLRFLGFSFLLLAVCGVVLWFLRVAGVRWQAKFYAAKSKP